MTDTFLLVSSSVWSKQLLCFVQGQGQKREQKHTTKNFEGFQNHSALLTMISQSFTRNTQNMLKSNPGKTDILHFTSRFKKQPSSLETLMLANSTIGIKAKAKNLGIAMDKILSFNDHINEKCKKASFAIRSIGHIRYLPYEGLKMLVNSLVISRLDYCNSVIYGIPKYQRDKLQRIQNIAARMIMTGTRSTGHITSTLKNLHWLPVEARINFKILLITYKILNEQSTSYFFFFFFFYQD